MRTKKAMIDLKSRRVRGCSFVATVAFLAACGPAATPNAPVVVPSEGVPPVAGAAESKPLPTGDTSAVAAPTTLVVSGHVRSLSEFEAQVGPGASAMLGDSVGDPRDTFDVSQPIDFAVTAGGKGRSLRASFALSFPLKNNVLTRTAFEHNHIVTEKDGVLYLEDKASDGSDSARHNIHCAVAASFGPSTHRMICGSDRPALEVLAPYLARTVTREEVKNLVDVHFDLHPLHETVRSFRALGEAMLEDRMDRRVRETFGPLIGRALDAYADYAVDLSSGDLAINSGASDTTATLTFNYETSKSVLTKAVLARSEKNGPPSEAFLQMPRDAKIVTAHSGVPKLAHEWIGEYKAALKLAMDQVPGGNRFTKEKAQATKMLTDLIDQLLADAPGAYGVGYQGSIQELKHNLESAWFALEQDAPVAKWIAIAKQIPQPKEAKGFIKFGPAAASHRLPAGSYTLEVTPPKRPPYLFAFVPLAKGRTLVAFAGSDATLQRLVGSLSGKDAKAQLGSVPAIDALKSAEANSYIALRANVFEVGGVADDDFITLSSKVTASGAGGASTLKVTAPKNVLATLIGALKRSGPSDRSKQHEPKVGPATPAD